MAIRMQAAATVAIALMSAACQMAHRSAPTATIDAAASPPHLPAPPAAASSGSHGKISDLSASDLHDVLSELDKNHHDRMKLAFWVSTPLRSADPAFKAFYKERGAAEKELANELEAWAKAHHVDLSYSYGTDTFGKAQKIMEDRQEKVVRADDKNDFGRDMLIDELQDYEFGISLVTALLPSVHDPALQAYLQKSLHSQEAASQQAQVFLKKFKYTG
jgi:hypothetical protein